MKIRPFIFTYYSIEDEDHMLGSLWHSHSSVKDFIQEAGTIDAHLMRHPISGNENLMGK